MVATPGFRPPFMFYVGRYEWEISLLTLLYSEDVDVIKFINEGISGDNFVGVELKNKTTLELTEDAVAGDIIDLTELNQVDLSFIEEAIDAHKDKVYDSVVFAVSYKSRKSKVIVFDETYTKLIVLNYSWNSEIDVMFTNYDTENFRINEDKFKVYWNNKNFFKLVENEQYGVDILQEAKNMQTKVEKKEWYEVNNYFERDHSRLILWSGSLEKEEPIVVDSPTSSLDILPTLSNLFGTEYDSRLFPGRDVFSDTEPLVFFSNYDWKTDYGTYIARKGKFIPKDKSVELPKDYVKNMKTIVRNKVRYCQMALDTDYYRHLFS